MLKKIISSVVIGLAVIGTVACSKNNPLVSDDAIDGLYLLVAKDQEWSSGCRQYYKTPDSAVHDAYKDRCPQESQNVYNKYKDHKLLLGATLEQFRDSSVWELYYKKYPNADWV